MIKIKAEEQSGIVSFRTEWDVKDGVSAYTTGLFLLVKVINDLAEGDMQARRRLYKMAEATFGALQNGEAEAELLALLGEGNGEEHIAKG